MLYRTKKNILRSVVFLHDGYHMVCFKKKKGDLKMAVIDIFQTQLVVTTECKRERFIYFFRVRTERKNMSGSKGLNQLFDPCGVYIDNDQTIYVADTDNHRIMEWKNDVNNGRIVAGGNRKGNRNTQLNYPTKVIVEKENDSLIICDQGNRRVVRWPRRNGQIGETIISNINCRDLTMDNDGYLYVSDIEKHEVRRWKIGETGGTIVAGGNGQGDRFDQLNYPEYIFIDQDHSVYVSDCLNHRVMKWVKGAKEGIIVAGGQGQGNGLRQLSSPGGIIVDQLGNIYVADFSNHRVMRWLKGVDQGTIVVGGNGEGKQSNQFNIPIDLSFDRENNLYVADWSNRRVQKFDVNLNKRL
jgi:sugar lactone lactonase YvrE